MEQTLISVIVPVYNAAATVKDTLYSITSQTTGSFEVIVVNDGSKDNSLDIVKSFAAQNSNGNATFKIIDQLNGGVSRARNTGLGAATGAFIAFIDADDEWLPNKTQQQLEILNTYPAVDYLGGRIHPRPLRNSLLKKFDRPITRILVKDLIFKNYFQPSTVILRKTVLDAIGLFREDQRYAEEGNYFMRIAHRFNCYLLDEQVIIYGQGKAGFGASGLSANIDEMEKGELMNLNFVHKEKYISTLQYLEALSFSLVKYARRKLVYILKK